MKITKIIDTTVIPLMLDLLGIYTGVLVNWKFDLSVSSSVSMGFVFCWVYLSYDG